MSNVLRAIRLDFYTMKSSYKAFMIIYGLAVLLAFTTQPTITIVIVMLFSVVFSGTAFAIYEKNHLSKLYGTLPLGRFEAVISRYLLTLFFGIVNGMVAGLLAQIASLIMHVGISPLVFAFYLAFSFLYFCFSIGVTFPVYYKYGFSKLSFIVTFLPLYIVVMICVFISKNVDTINSIKQALQYLADNPIMIWVAGIGIGLILLTISCPLSCLIYKRHEL